MSPRASAKVAFASAVVMLFLCGVTTLVIVWRYSGSAQWVNHTYEVKVATGKVESTLSEAARNRLSFVTTRDPNYLQRYQKAKQQVSDHLSSVRELTLDNPHLQDQFRRLSDLVNQRIAILQSSMDRQVSGQRDSDLESSASMENTSLATDIAGIIAEMQNEEDLLLEARKKESSKLFAFTVSTFALLLCSAVLLLWVHYRLLNGELRRREDAENGARRLSVQVLEMQDEERRKFSRELHDGLGQSLAVAKMMALSVLEKHPEAQTAEQLIEVLQRSIQETRTISHLLHPPLLDELGIASAASWYLDEFSKRSGLQISASIPDEIGRLPRAVELVLFRVLQESLTNVHRHSQSSRVEISLWIAGGNAVLQVRDYGIGIPQEKLEQFRSRGTHAGVGLTGMRERVREHGGQFEIHSSQSGTEVLVAVPLRDGHGGERAAVSAAAAN
jgi:signal transduction histidine kinase